MKTYTIQQVLNSSNLKKFNAGTRWSDYANSFPIYDIREADKKINTENYQMTYILYMNKKNIESFMRHPEIVNIIEYQPVQITNILRSGREVLETVGFKIREEKNLFSDVLLTFDRFYPENGICDIKDCILITGVY